MPYTDEELKFMFGDLAGEARKQEDFVASIERPSGAQNVFGDRLERLKKASAAVQSSLEATMDDVKRLEQKRDDLLAQVLPAGDKAGLAADTKDNDPDEDNLTEKFKELQAMRTVLEGERAKVNAARSINALYAHIVPISWYKEASKTRACGVLGEPGALQEVDITSESQFDIVQEMWKRME